MMKRLIILFTETLKKTNRKNLKKKNGLHFIIFVSSEDKIHHLKIQTLTPCISKRMTLKCQNITGTLLYF